MNGIAVHLPEINLYELVSQGIWHPPIKFIRDSYFRIAVVLKGYQVVWRLPLGMPCRQIGMEIPRAIYREVEFPVTSCFMLACGVWPILFLAQ